MIQEHVGLVGEARQVLARVLQKALVSRVLLGFWNRKRHFQSRVFIVADINRDMGCGV